MSRMWASFIHDKNPNFHNRMFHKNVTVWYPITNSACAEGAVQWPPYSLESPTNYVFDANVSSHLEPDTYRADGIDYLIEKLSSGTYPWATHDQSK
jgi:triacylglycerol lipase